MSQQVNLFNPLFRPKGFSFTSAKAMLYAMGIAVAAVAVASVYEDYTLREVAARAQATEAMHKEATSKLSQLTNEVAQQKPNAQIEADIAALETQLKGRQEIVETLRSGAVGNTSGFSEYMRAFSRQTVTGLWLTGFEFDGNDLVLHGRTVNPELVASFLKQLNREQSLQGREFSAMRIRQPAAEGTADAGKGEPEKAAKAAAARYHEFSISTAPLPEDPRKADARPVAVSAPTAPPAAAVPIDTNKVIEATKAALKQEPAK